MAATITTLVSSNHYQYFLPIFSWSVNRSFKIKPVVFVRGKLNPEVRDFLKTRAIVYEKMFPKHPTGFANNALRFLVPTEAFADYEYIFFTDADFIYTPNGMINKLISMIKANKTPYMGLRGNASGLRMAGGCLMVTKEWLLRTDEIRNMYVVKLKKKAKNLVRHYDEIMLYNMCKKARMGVPAKKGKFLGGAAFNSSWRSIHLGDFKDGRRFTRRRADENKMKRLLTDNTIKRFKKMRSDESYKLAAKTGKKNSHFKKMWARFKQHLKQRGADV